MLSCITFVSFAVLFTASPASPASPASATSPASADTTPTVTTDQSVYGAGATVVLSGAGWQAGETVHVVVSDADGIVLNPTSLQPWSFVDDVTAAADGTIADTFPLPLYYVRSYDVTASGPSGTATATFSDDSIDFTQCANSTGAPTGTIQPCDWVNGDLNQNNSVYSEGDVVPQRTIRTVADAGPHYTTIDHNFYKGGAYTYDFFATPDYTQGSDLNPCDGISNSAGIDSAQCQTLYDNKAVVPIPDEGTYTISSTTYTYPFVAGAEADAASNGVTRNLWIACGVPGGTKQAPTMTAAPCTGVGISILGHGDTNKNLLPGSGQQGPPSAEDFTQMKVDFTTPDPNTFVAIWVGGHLAKTSYWNNVSNPAFQGGGAATASGASYHVRLIDWDLKSGIGSRDNQIHTSGIVPSGSLTIVKDDTAKTSTPFSFTADGPLSPGSFSLCDPSSGSCSSSQQFSSLPSGTYTVSENAEPAGWAFGSVTCTVGTSTYSANGASAVVDLQPGDNVTCTFTNNQVVPPVSSLMLTKSTMSSGYSAAGQTVFYNYLVTNTGNTTISSIAITDNKVAPANLSCPQPSLAPGDSETCSGTYTTTQTDVDTGKVTNTATASGTNPSNAPVTSNPSSVTVKAVGTTSSLSLAKSTTSSGYSAAGQTVFYHYLVTNTGTTTISSVTVSDSLIASVSCPQPVLAPGVSEICTGSYTTTQGDVDAGSVTNNALSSGVDADNNPVTSNQSTVTVRASGTTSSLSLTKTASTPGYSAAGQTILYNYLVTNTGTTTISSITVTDDHVAPANLTCPQPSLAPGFSETCTGSYTTTQADVDTGKVTNTATASGTDPSNAPITSNHSTATVQASGTTSALSLVKTALTSGYSVSGETLSYNYLVTNTGTTTISSITVSDDHVAPANLTCPQPSLAPGNSETCTGTYKSTQADVDAGSVTNTATASGTDPFDNSVTSEPSMATVPASRMASISIDKTTNGSDGLNIPVGATVTWAYQVTNSGNVTLTEVTVTDNQVAASAINCGGGSNVIPSLAPGSTVTCTATGTAVAGTYANTGTATGTTPTSASVQASDDSGYYGVQDLSVTKSANPTLTRTYDWSVAKKATPPLIERLTGGTATAGFLVTATQAGHTDGRWQVTGTITVTNPNSDEAVTAHVTDALDNGGTCLVAGSASDAVPVAASSSATVDYVCTYASAPSSANGTNTATASWDRSAASTPQGSATGHATFTFGTGSTGNPTSVDRCILVTDAFDGGPATTLGTDCVGPDPVTENFGYTAPVTVPMSLTAPATLPGTTVTPTTVSFVIPSAGNWGLVLTPVTNGHTLAFDRGTSGTLSVRVPVSDTCQYQYDIQKNGQFYEGAKTTIPRCGGQPNCLTDPNTATLVPTGQSASASVEVCGAAATGAKSMSSWKTSLQAAITGGASTGGVCNSATWLRRFAPFQDLGATAGCTAVGAYVSRVIGAASPTSIPTMLKAQMLATALNVYFSNPTLGGDKIAAPTPIGGLSVDLTKICMMVDTAHGSTCGNLFADTATDGHGAWGGAPKLTVTQLLLYAAGKSNVGGTVWYGNVAAAQQDAKNTFDAINNLAAFVP